MAKRKKTTKAAEPVDYLTTGAISERFGVPHSTIHLAVKNGELHPSSRHLGKGDRVIGIGFAEKDVTDWIAAKSEDSGSAPGPGRPRSWTTSQKRRE